MLISYTNYSRTLLMLMLIVVTSLSAAKPPEVVETTLSNGLKVIVMPIAKPDAVVAMVWYNVGSSDEVVGTTGVAHALEHMMFKGTDNTRANEYSERIAATGGQENAFTNRDYTAYFAKIDKRTLPLFLSLEADRMQHLTLSADEFTQEIKVVQEERRMRIDDSPMATLFERLTSVAHLGNAYHQPVIGWMEDLMHMTIDDLRQWYHTWYTPNNATLVLAGDLQPEATIKLVQKYFGSIPSEKLPIRKPQAEPPGVGPKQLKVTTQLPNQLPTLVMGYMVPSLNTSPDLKTAYTLEVINALLSDGKNSLLERKIVRGSQTATDVGARYDLYAKYDNLFMVYGVSHDNASLQPLNKDIETILTQLATQPISKTELKRVKNNLIAEKIYSKDSLFGQAMEVGILSTIGRNWQDSEDYIKRINQITVDDIQRVAKTYFVENRKTTARLINKDSDTLPRKN